MSNFDHPRPVVPAIGLTNASLETEVTAMRDLLRVDRRSDAVIVQPAHQGYDPLIDERSGRMQVGSYGLEDFRRRFGHLEVAAPKMYVGYMALRAGLESIKDTNSTFADGMRIVARRARYSGIFTDMSENKAVLAILGYQAANIAIEMAIKDAQVRSRDDLKARIKFAAEKKLPILPSPKMQEQRLKVKAHFTMSSRAEIDKEILRTMTLAIRNR